MVGRAVRKILHRLDSDHRCVDLHRTPPLSTSTTLWVVVVCSCFDCAFSCMLLLSSPPSILGTDHTQTLYPQLLRPLIIQKSARLPPSAREVIDNTYEYHNYRSWLSSDPPFRTQVSLSLFLPPFFASTDIYFSIASIPFFSQHILHSNHSNCHPWRNEVRSTFPRFSR